MSELFGIKIPQDRWGIVPCIILATVYLCAQQQTGVEQHRQLPLAGKWTFGRAPGRQQALLH
jgi:hypothetical protein